MARFTVLTVAVFTACLAAPYASALAAETVVKKIMPARVEATNDAKIMKVTLTPKAAERLGIAIDEVRADPSGRLIVPYASVCCAGKGKYEGVTSGHRTSPALASSPGGLTR